MRSTRPVILIIENSTAVTGALKSIIGSSFLLRNDYEFIFILPSNSKARSYIESFGFSVHEIRMMELRKKIFSLIAYVPTLVYNIVSLFKIIKNTNARLIVNNDFYNLMPAGYRFLGGAVPYICYVRFLPSKFPAILVNTWCKLHSRYAAAVVAVSEVVKQELPIKAQVTVINNELPLEDAAFTAPTTKTILYCANYILGKGQEHAVESFALISEKFPEWTLRFVGGDMGLKKNRMFKAQLMQRAEALGLNSKIEWREFEPNVTQMYLDAAFVLNFSESESFSMTCLEAQFYGRPVVATKSGGPSEIIDDNVTGIMVNLRDVPAMADAMKYLITNPDKRASMAQQAYTSARKKFSFENTIGKLHDLYNTLIH